MFRKPIHNVFVTRECNLECPFCFSSRIREHHEDDLSAILQAVARIDADMVRLCGGEPLVHFDRVKSIYESIRPDAQVLINTNGKLLTPEIIQWANERRVIIQLSVDGYIKGHRPLVGLDVDLLKTIDQLWVNQIMFHPEDVLEISAVLEPQVHELSLLYGQGLLDPDLLERILEVADGRFIARVDPGQYWEATTHHNGKTYQPTANRDTDHCIKTRQQIGEYAWNALRNR